MPKITYLEVHRDVEAHAVRFGAKRDAAGRWYVTGEVPIELLNYLPRMPKRRFDEAPPGCPLCRSGMRKAINRRSGDLHWVCMARFKTGCQGTVDYVAYLEQVEQVPAIGDLTSELTESLLSARLSLLHTQPGGAPGAHPLHSQWIEIVKLAFAALGNERQVMLWLKQPKLSLRGQTPISKLGTTEGCEAVDRLLRELWD